MIPVAVVGAARRSLLAAALLAFALAPAPARADAEDDAFPRKGLHTGLGIGPIVSRYLDIPRDVYGIDTRLFINVGLTKVVDFRFGLTGDAAGSQVSLMSVGVPVELRFNLGRTHSFALGFSAGFVTDTTTIGFFLGPEWSLLTLRFGRQREFEVELSQGVHFHLGRTGSQPDLIHLQGSLVLSYLFLGS